MKVLFASESHIEMGMENAATESKAVQTNSNTNTNTTNNNTLVMTEKKAAVQT